jgi:hypothetical protein
VPGQVVDTPAVEEFMRETLEKVSPDVLGQIARDLGRKSDHFRTVLGAEGPVDGDVLAGVLRCVFVSRRKVDALLDEVGVDTLGAEVDRLLHGDELVASRVERFQDGLAAFPEVAFELPSELLHFTFPDRYWLWSRWMFDPRTETGALALVTEDEFDFGDAGPGETYVTVGEAVAFVSETGRATGLLDQGDDPFSLDVFLACVYAVYMYTVLRLRMTQEFTQIVPEQAELVRRLLGVHHLEV